MKIAIITIVLTLLFVVFSSGDGHKSREIQKYRKPVAPNARGVVNYTPENEVERCDD